MGVRGSGPAAARWGCPRAARGGDAGGVSFARLIFLPVRAAHAMSRRRRQEASPPCMHLACSRASEQSCDGWTRLSIRWVGGPSETPTTPVHHERHGDVRRRRPPVEKRDRSGRVHVGGGDGSDWSGGHGRHREMNRDWICMYGKSACLHY